MRLQRAENGYIVRQEFFDEDGWRAYLKKAMARRRDYRPLDFVIEETGSPHGFKPRFSVPNQSTSSSKQVAQPAELPGE